MDFLPVSEQLTRLTRGVDTILPEGDLEGLLGEGRPLRVKLGVDPTAPDVTLGWAVVLRLLRRFQELGHVAVLILGDFTAQVGDPSGKSETRRRLSGDEVDSYVGGVMGTIRELLLPDNLEVRPNSEWLAKMDMHDVLDLMSKFTVSRIMDRDDFSKRWDAGDPISLIEFMYPLLQAYDSVAVEADIEIGGTDQLFNLLVGRDLQSRSGQRPQVVMTMPLLVGTDGARKMSQSLGNYVSVTDEPSEMFGKTMSIPDGAMRQWMVLAAERSEAEADDAMHGIEVGRLHPGDAKRALAREIVALYWGAGAAEEAEAAFDRVFREHGAPDEVDDLALPSDDPVWLPGLIASGGLAASNSEARRLLDQGAVKLDGEKLTDLEVPRSRLVGALLQVGKRRFARLIG
ncbi:MAG TPA: tyrosine--tRNA ligase [Acidimicrobiia bacterium]|jgi:tyrosyl-tRNA synthetase